MRFMDLSFSRVLWLTEGDLRILPGTRIKIKDDTGGDVYACVMEHNMIINGGLSSTLYSYGKEDINYSFESNNSSKTLSQLSSRMDRAMMMTKEINDSKGGVFQIIDADGDGINDSFIMRNADGKGSFIRGNKDGIWFQQGRRRYLYHRHKRAGHMH